jgi:hypothetical protein
MWTIIHKEFRENWMYLIGGIIIVLIGLNNAAGYMGWNYILPNESIVWTPRYFTPIPTEAWALLCAWGATIIALKLVYEEQWRKTWPLLAHLPTTRGRMIYGKFLGGLIIYSLLTLPAGLLMVLRLSTPGVWPGPFHPFQIMELVYPWLGGIGIYIVAFFTALRPARWYGTKWVPAVLILILYASFYRFGIRYVQSIWMYDQMRGLLVLLSFASLTGATLLLLWGIKSQALTREY